MVYFIISFIVIVILVSLRIWGKNNKPKNKVHFYVARDKHESLWLYLGKPIRVANFFAKIHGYVLTESYGFKEFGLNKDDFDNLKWEDEPVEVFINMED